MTETSHHPLMSAPADDPAKVSRREFIKRVIASGAVASAALYVYGGLSGCGRKGAVAGGVERLVSLNVNGAVRRVDVLPQETLAMTLRYKLGLTGTKLGCDRSECGACTVMIDDVTHYSCSTLTHAVRGIDPETGQYYDDTKRYIDALRLSDADRYRIFEGNARRVYSRLDARLRKSS